MPLKNRWLSSCLLSVFGHSVLIDCGEGTQIALKWAGQKSKPIDVICFTHFHADHISGLPGFLLTMSNEGRTEPLTMIGPVGLETIVRALCLIAPNLTFDIRFIEIPSDGTVIQSEPLTITPFRVRHGVPCLGYCFELKRVGKFDKEKALKNEVPLKVWSKLQHQDSVIYNGVVYTSDMVLGAPRKGLKVTYTTDTRPVKNIAVHAAGSAPRKGLKVTYTTDTRPVKNIAVHAAGSDLLICEGMFAEEDKLERAIETGHMLFSEAAGIASQAQVKKLWLTHYSPSLEYPEEGLSFASAVFPQTECGFDGKTEDLLFEE